MDLPALGRRLHFALEPLFGAQSKKHTRSYTTAPEKAVDAEDLEAKLTAAAQAAANQSNADAEGDTEALANYVMPCIHSDFVPERSAQLLFLARADGTQFCDKRRQDPCAILCDTP